MYIIKYTLVLSFIVMFMMPDFMHGLLWMTKEVCPEGFHVISVDEYRSIEIECNMWEFNSGINWSRGMWFSDSNPSKYMSRRYIIVSQCLSDVYCIKCVKDITY